MSNCLYTIKKWKRMSRGLGWEVGFCPASPCRPSSSSLNSNFHGILLIFWGFARPACQNTLLPVNSDFYFREMAFFAHYRFWMLTCHRMSSIWSVLIGNMGVLPCMTGCFSSVWGRKRGLSRGCRAGGRVREPLLPVVAHVEGILRFHTFSCFGWLARILLLFSLELK